MTKRIPPARLKQMLRDGEELALLDVREEGAHSLAHLLYAACLPMSRLELLLPGMLPRWSVRIVLVDDGGGLADRAADRLSGFGYDDVAVLDGGIKAWKSAGYELFSGIHVPSKAFGEMIEQRQGTPHISAEELNGMLERGEDLVILDSRPLNEFREMNIPTGINCPGAELVYRVHEMAPRPETLVVVNCAGRTRSIIGAQSLINAGIPNRVIALENGTMGWLLAGFDLEHGQERTAPEVTAEGRARAGGWAADVARRHGVRTIDRDTLGQWRGEAQQRTLYVLDVRSPGEYERGHPAGVANAPGGQLVQETESWCPVLGSRIVLVDDTGVRATMTAHWLVQMGWDCVVLAGGLDGFDWEGPDLKSGPAGTAFDHGAGDVAETTPAELQELITRERVTVIDLARSPSYKKAHIPGAWWAVRARLAQALPAIPAPERIVLTSSDGRLARLAVGEVSEITGVAVSALAGGTRAWIAAGYPTKGGWERMADDRDDVWLKPYEQEGSAEDFMRAYLSWEVDLIAAVERDGDHRFRLPPK